MEEGHSPEEKKFAETFAEILSRLTPQEQKFAKAHVEIWNKIIKNWPDAKDVARPPSQDLKYRSEIKQFLSECVLLFAEKQYQQLSNLLKNKKIRQQFSEPIHLGPPFEPSSTLRNLEKKANEALSKMPKKKRQHPLFPDRLRMLEEHEKPKELKEYHALLEDEEKIHYIKAVSSWEEKEKKGEKSEIIEAIDRMDKLVADILSPPPTQPPAKKPKGLLGSLRKIFRKKKQSQQDVRKKFISTEPKKEKKPKKEEKKLYKPASHHS